MVDAPPGTPDEADTRIEALERQLAEARAETSKWREAFSEMHRQTMAAEAERDRLAADNARLREALTDVLDRFVDAFPSAATYGPIIRARAAVENGCGNV